MTTETLHFDNLQQYLLLKNGNFLYKVPFRGGFACLKVYYGSRTQFQYVAETISNYLGGQTSFMPRARRTHEYEVLKVWRDAGFRVFKVYDDVKVDGLPDDGYRLFEFVQAPKFVDYFSDSAVSLDDKTTLWRRFLPQWAKRHQLAVSQREPRLIHENGDLKHVMILDDGELLYFDFEMTYRSESRVEEFAARELLAYLKSLGKCVGHEAFPHFLDETVRGYPCKELLHKCYEIMFRHANPIRRLGRCLERRLKPRAMKTFSKHNVALMLHERLKQGDV